MDPADYILTGALIVMFYFVAPRWISKLLKRAAQEGIGGAILDIFTGMYYNNPDTGEEFELTPQESLLIFSRSVGEHMAAAAVQTMSTEAPIHMTCLFSEAATEKMAKAGNPIAQKWSEIPRGHRGAIKAGIKDVVQSVVPVPEPLEGTPKLIFQWGRALMGMGVDVSGFANKAMSSMGGGEEVAEAAVEVAAPAAAARSAGQLG